MSGAGYLTRLFEDGNMEKRSSNLDDLRNQNCQFSSLGLLTLERRLGSGEIPKPQHHRRAEMVGLRDRSVKN